MKVNAFQTILRAGLLAGFMDITAAIVISIIRGRTAVRLLQSVATGLLGMDAYDGGVSTAVLGTMLHFTIAFSLATIYFAASRRFPILTRQPVLCGILYGTAVYFFMNHVVLPLSAFPHKMRFQLLTGLGVHIVCIGLPIALMTKRGSKSTLHPSKERSISMPLCFLISASLLVTLPSFLFAQKETVRATFAGGCFWCMEEAFEGVEGIVSVTSGFESDVEAVDIQYDPEKITYRKLLEVFWKNVDPTDSDGQFCDRGSKYRSVIFYHDDEQLAEAEQSKREIQQALNRPIVTEVRQADLFSVAPEEDQDFYKKKPDHYKAYKTKCGRMRRLRELW